MSFTVERDWITAAGLRAVVVFVDNMGHRCGYVGVPASHALYGKDYDSAYGDADLAVHGGLTYAEGRADYPATSDGLWWFGYDCAHCGDARDPDWLRAKAKAEPQSVWLYMPSSGEVARDTDYCVRECESLATQLAELP